MAEDVAARDSSPANARAVPAVPLVPSAAVTPEVPSDATALLFNPFLPDVHADPYPAYRRLRETDPVHSAFPGFTPQIWLLSRHRDVSAVLRDHRVSNDRRKSELFELMLQSLPEPLRREELAPSMLFLDPPDHTRLRSLVSTAFSARGIGALRPRVEEIVKSLLDRVADAGSMDVVADLAYPLPVTVICDMLAVPKADRSQMRRWSMDLIHTLDPMTPVDALGRAQQAAVEFRGFLRELIAERRQHPGEDLLSELIAAEAGGERLTEAEMVSTCVLLLVAGHETTSGLVGNGTLALLRNPGELGRLREDPSLIRLAVEELLRYDSPVQLTGRLVLEDLEIDGRSIRKGEEIVALTGAANRDPERFPDPDRLDLGRTDTRHVAFGGGIHFCLGAPLARLEGRVAIAELVRRMPNLELAGEPEWRDTVTLRGLRSLPVAF